MSVADRLEPREANQAPHGQTAVDEPVMNDHVGEAEGRHPRACTDRAGRQRSMQIASDHHEQCRGGRVGRGEDVVRLEATLAARVVRTMNVPQAVMPDAAVEKARPGFHRGRYDRRNERAERDGTDASHRVRS